MRWFCLDLHASYQCRHAGVCCGADWQIPAEAHVVTTVELRGIAGSPDRGIGEATSLFVRSDEDDTLVVRRRRDGTCVFYDRGHRLCDIHRVAGSSALPSACRHFPREILLDRRGAFVSLSHFCPTAAALLLAESPLRIVEALPPLQIDGPIEGLDATDALAPLVRPGLLSDLDGYAAWERCAIDALARPELTARQALDFVAAATEEIRDWRPGDGPLAVRVEDAFRHRVAVPFRSSIAFADLCARHFPPAGGPVEGFEALWDCHVEPALPALNRAISNYVAARLFGNWVAYQGRGLRTIVEWLRTALAVVENELARRAAVTRRPATSGDLLAAAGAADWLLLHTIDSEGLARDLSAVEDGVGSRASRQREPA